MSYIDSHHRPSTETIETVETVETVETIETDEYEEESVNDMHPHITISGKRYYAIPGRDGYFISRDGRVYSQRRNRELVVYDSNKGYLIVRANCKTCCVHRLLWETFKGPIPPGMTVNHINHDRHDNRLENLELVSNRENCNKRSCHENIHELPDGAVGLDDVEYRTPCNTYHIHNLHYYDHCVFERFDTCYRVIRPCAQGRARVNGILVHLRKLLRLIEEQLQSEEQQPE